MLLAHILSLAYKSKFTHGRTWDLNIGPGTDHFTELSFTASETLAVTITIVVRGSVTRSLPHQDSIDINYLIMDYLKVATAELTSC